MLSVSIERTSADKQPDTAMSRKFAVERDNFPDAEPARCRDDHHIDHAKAILNVL